MNPLYILMLSLHGLIRGHDLELGRDADTGGQTLYVVELARALGRHDDVERVDLLTRLIDDPQLSADYAQEEEILGPGARLVRLPFGPRRYLRKEVFWNHLDLLVDRIVHYLRQQARLPDVIHSHYADAGYVGTQLSQLLGIPLIHTGHSLGRCKRQRLLAHGRKPLALERQFNFARRIAAEETILANAQLIIASTPQETQEQYGLYENYQPGRALVIPPGTDTSRFAPPGKAPLAAEVPGMLDRFLTEPRKPLILAICRPEVRKNLLRLVEAYGNSDELRQRANLAIIAGQRDDLRDLDEDQAKVLTDLLLAVDRFDLWGKVALPKRHRPEDIPQFYRLAAQRHGVFANPALTEPFGLTLIEAAASGLPIVATADGGPRDIIANCNNGILIDPLDSNDIARGLLEVLGDARAWRRRAQHGLSGVSHHYTWDAHVAKYLKAVRRLARKERKQIRRELAAHLHPGPATSLPFVQRMLVSDIDNTLIGDRHSLTRLIEVLRTSGRQLGFAVATGRSLESTLSILRQWRVPRPDALITSVGSEIHYGRTMLPDNGWIRHIRHRWRRDALADLLTGIPGLILQQPENQREFKLSYLVDPASMPPLRALYKLLQGEGLHANLIYSHQAYLDVLPIRASKGQAVRYLAYKWGLPLRNFLVAGDSGNDAEMLVGDTLGVVVANHSPELQKFRGLEQIYFASNRHAAGILEGMAHYGFIVTEGART
ncbi:Sucrose-phosphate phosphatase [Sterolibacterium denitrificans]|uniref:sucrose-phosphate synthase n=1 Tax=Sterolibacterium denitrificans TaxID=157592 RepID=A0A7Z7HQG5_9PROT|nr:HAD family hydrolase [Sterolibacterium denitrificans]SMB24193.1 Sucrose-phosphate phosphatase [Sterolibacterium denitrificans]